MTTTNDRSYRPGDTVRVFKYGAWYRGTVQSVTRLGAMVRFVAKNGNVKVQRFTTEDSYSIRKGY